MVVEGPISELPGVIVAPAVGDSASASAACVIGTRAYRFKRYCACDQRRRPSIDAGQIAKLAELILSPAVQLVIG